MRMPKLALKTSFSCLFLVVGLGCSAGGGTAVPQPDQAPEPEAEASETALQLDEADQAEPADEPEPVARASFQWITVEQPRQPEAAKLSDIERRSRQRLERSWTQIPHGKCYTFRDCRRAFPDAESDFRCELPPYCSGPGECVPVERQERGRGDQVCGDAMYDYCDCNGQSRMAYNTCGLPANVLYRSPCGSGPDELPEPQKLAALNAIAANVQGCARDYQAEHPDAQGEVTVALRIRHWEDEWSLDPKGGVVMASRLVKDEVSSTGEVGDCVREVMATAHWPTPLGMRAEFEESFSFSAQE